MSTSEVPHVIEHELSDAAPRHRLEHWDLGPGAHFLQTTGTAMRMVRGPRQIRVAAPERLAIARYTAPAVRWALGVPREVPVGELFLVDQTSAHESRDSGGMARAFIVDYEMLGLPVDLARRALPRVTRSPLYELVQSHFNRLCVGHDELGSDAAAMLGAATTELLRALIVTAVDADSSQQRESLHFTLLLRIKHYIEQHLTEPTLTVETIAATHNISVRHVYQVWAGSELTLSQWIIRARLEGTRRELARSGPDPAIGRVAQHWGFIDAAHFSRRFRAAYGMSPRQWRQLCATGDSGSAIEP